VSPFEKYIVIVSNLKIISILESNLVDLVLFYYSYSLFWFWSLLWDALDTNNFYFILFYFSDFILILFFFCFCFCFEWWRGMWHYSHMTGHMMWHHRPRTWWKNLENDVRVHVYNMVALSRKWGGHKVVVQTICTLYI